MDGAVIMTRVLITGAGGFVGHHFFEHSLVETDWDVVLTDSFRHKGKTDRIREVLDNAPKMRPAQEKRWYERTQVITHDLTVPFSKQAVQAMGEIDYIVAFASESHVDRSISDPVPFIKNNTDVVLTTMELARELKPKAVVWVSTDEVYGSVEADDLIGHPEWDAILPSNPYSASKAAQEAIAISYWRTYGVPLSIVNCMNMIGERQDAEKYIPMVTAKVFKGEEVTIHGEPGNIGTRHYLHARNLASGILFLLQETIPVQFPAHVQAYEALHPEFTDQTGQGDRPDRYNISAPDRINNLTLAQMIAAAIGKPLKYKLEDFHSTRPGHDPHYGLDPSKLTDLGWSLPIPFADSLKRTVEWTLEHPEWLIQD
jgi:dTDP-glucose 4,6-dehydratase